MKRRAFLNRSLSTFLAAWSLQIPFGAAAVGGFRRPDRRLFEAGDFLWTADPNLPTPYAAKPDDEEALYEEQKNNFIRQITSHQKREFEIVGKLIQQMSFAEYMFRFSNDLPLNYTSTSYGGLIGTGHVAIVSHFDASHYHIIEATGRIQNPSVKSGVIQRSYDNWVKEYDGYIVWHGRLKDATSRDRQSLVSIASQYIGRPYNFFNFDLSDDRDFYCSKLVWLSCFKALNIALDGNSSSWRVPWVSPKQLRDSRYVEILQSPDR